MTKRAIIVGAAPGQIPLERLEIDCNQSIVICADGGRNTLERLGIVPDWYVGDNDSGGRPDGLPSMLLPPEKDVSDLEMAVDKAFELGCNELILTGCTGGRLDHELANLGLLEQIAQRGAQGMLVNAENEVRFLKPGCYVIENRPAYRYLGLIPMDEAVTSLSISGTKYPLQGFTMVRGSTRTISNEIEPGKRAVIRFESGNMLLIRSVPFE